MTRKSIFLILFLYLIVLVGFYFFQQKIIFRAKKLPPNFKYSFSGEFKEHWVNSGANGKINALHFKAKNPKGILLYFHGNKGNLERWGSLVAPYTQYDYDVFVIDYRGYGKSTGNRRETAMYEDGLKAYDYIKNSLHFTEDQIVVYGRSLGCTFATRVAAANQPKHLVLEAPFNSMLEVVSSKFPLLPYRYVLKFQFKTYRDIAKVTAPTLIFHGDEDTLIPIASAKRLAQAAVKTPLQFITIPGGTHHNLTEFLAYKSALQEILD